LHKLSVIICEDDVRQRERIEEIVANCMKHENWNIEVDLATECPLRVLEHVQSIPDQDTLYILDVNLNHELNGIDLAAQIREYDKAGRIIFVTTHGELSHLTFTYKLEVMDYIIKDNPEGIIERIEECIYLAVTRLKSNHNTVGEAHYIKIGNKLKPVPYKEIMFFASSDTPHKVILHMENGVLEFYGSIKSIAESHPHFYRCHKSYVVNLQNVKNVDRVQKKIEMVNGSECIVSMRGIPGLMKALKVNQKKRAL